MARAWITDRRKHDDYRAALARWREATKAGTTRRQAPGRWRVGWYDLRSNQKSKTFARKPDAEAFKSKIEHDLRANTYRDPKSGDIAVSEVAESWFTARKPKWARRTVGIYRDYLDHYVIPRWGTTPVGRIEHEEIAAWLAGLFGKPGVTGSAKRTIGASHVRGIHRTFSQVLKWAVKSGRIAANPAAEMDSLPDKPQPKRLYLTHQRVDTLAAAVGKLETAYGKPRPGRDAYRVLVRLLAYTGLRWGEVSALKAGRVDLKARRLLVAEAYGEDNNELFLGPPKGGKTRTVGIPLFLADELKPYVEGHGPDELVFASPEGDPLRGGNFRNRIFSPAVKAAKFTEQVTPHTLRHTFASLSVAAGCDVKTLQAAMGHATAAMTLDVYADLFPARVGEVADALGKARDLALMGGETVPEPN